MTRSTSDEAALKHVLDQLLGASDATHPIRKALKFSGIDTFKDLLNLSEDDARGLRYQTEPRKDDKGRPLTNTIEEVPLKLGHYKRIVMILRFKQHTSDNGKDLENKDWIVVTQDEFDAFRLG